MTTGSIRGLNSQATTRAAVREVLERFGGRAAQKPVVGMFKAAASADLADRHLSADEAALVGAMLEESRTPAGEYDVAAARAQLDALLAERLRSENRDGITSYFTSIHDDIGDRILDSFQETIDEANGRPVDLNVMIFAFTHTKMKDDLMAMVEDNPNVRLNLIADFGQLSTAGGRKPTVMVREARERGIEDRINIKFKKDNPWVWNERAGRPVYHHGSTKGLNHHKLWQTLIEGRPHKMGIGSFNWSETAEDKNFENLFILDRKNPANRPMMEAAKREFVAYINHPDTLNLEQAQHYKANVMNALKVANGRPAGRVPAEGAPSPLYVPHIPPPLVDINHLTDQNHETLRTLVPDSKTARSIVYQYGTYGPFNSFENLLERVSAVRRLRDDAQAALRNSLEFGTGKVQLNRANATELARSLKIPARLAGIIVAAREEAGFFESVEEIRTLPGMSSSMFNRIAPRLDDDLNRLFFSARAFSDERGGTGYADHGDVAIMGPDGQIEVREPDLASPVLDLIRRAEPGETVKLGFYGMSASTEEFRAIVDGANRGVRFEVALNRAYNEGVARALYDLGLDGLPVEVRYVRGPTMHEKFGVKGDDGFFGSANMSGSSSSKHSENRGSILNNQELAGELEAEHDRLWARGVDIYA